MRIPGAVVPWKRRHEGSQGAVGVLRSLVPLRLRQEQRIFEGQVEQGQRRDSCEIT